MKALAPESNQLLLRSRDSTKTVLDLQLYVEWFHQRDKGLRSGSNVVR